MGGLSTEAIYFMVGLCHSTDLCTIRIITGFVSALGPDCVKTQSSLCNFPSELMRRSLEVIQGVTKDGYNFTLWQNFDICTGKRLITVIFWTL